MKNKVFTFFLVILIIISIFPNVTSAGDETIGLTDTSIFTQGDGSAENPFGVSTPEQLNAVRFIPDAYFVLLNDIDMITATSIGGDYYNDGAGWEPIGDNTTPFSGVFDGSGYAISNLIINNPLSNYIGLFGKITGTVMRLGIRDCDITADDSGYEEIYVGSIVGLNYGTISQCYNTGVIKADCYHAEVGGIAGSSGHVEKCFNTGLILADGYYANIGGIIGSYGSITECYNTGNIEMNGDNTGALSGCSGTLTNCYFINRFIQATGSNTGSNTNVVRLTADEIIQQSKFIGFDFDNIWEMSTDPSFPCPILKSVAFPAYVEDYDSYEGGSGTIFNPYKISTPEQLNNVRDYLGAFFTMLNNIDMSEATSDGGICYNEGTGWIPIGADQGYAFCGGVDGNGFVISGLKSSNSSLAALFLQNDGEIKNLGLEDVYFNTNGGAAGVTGHNAGIINNCYCTGEIIAHSSCGGIAGSSTGTISNCYNTAKLSSISSFYNVGGIAAYLGDNAQIIYCYNTGNIELLNMSGRSGIGAAGGIIGQARYGDETIIENCFNIGSVYVEDDNDLAGGIVGDGIEEIYHCYNIGIINGSDYNAAIISRMTSDTVVDTYFLDTGEEDLRGAYRSSDDTELSNIKTDEEMMQQATFAGFDFDNIWEMPETGPYLYPVLQDVSIDPFKSETEMFAGGLGTLGSPYIISTPEHLNNIRYYDYKYFVLANDIDMSSATSEGGAYYNEGLGFEPIGFSSTLHVNFDGNGYTISGLNINRPDKLYIGLFGCISSSSIKNLNLVDADIIGAYDCGGIAGYCAGDIISCTVDGSVIGVMAQSNNGVGGIVGRIVGDISCCTNYAEVSSYAQTGGIVGYIKGDIYSSCNHGVVNGLGSNPIGGIVGVTWGAYKGLL